jgi:hypothetical protein
VNTTLSSATKTPAASSPSSRLAGPSRTRSSRWGWARTPTRRARRTPAGSQRSSHRRSR